MTLRTLRHLFARVCRNDAQELRSPTNQRMGWRPQDHRLTGDAQHLEWLAERAQADANRRSKRPPERTAAE